MKRAIREALEQEGKLEGIKAQLRAQVFHAVDGSNPDSMARPSPTAETMLVHELIRDYLEFAGLTHTLSVLQSEASLSPAPLPRSVLSTEMGLPGAPNNVPVMYSLVAEGLETKKAGMHYTKQ